MKPALKSPIDHTSIEQKSDLIKSEIAKYRQLKSKGIIDASEDIKENKLTSRATALHSPSQQDSYRSALALVHTNSPQTVNHANSSLKSDYWGNPSKKGSQQPLQSFYSGPSIQTAGDTFRGSTSNRDRNIVENYAAYFSTPAAKTGITSLNSFNMTNPRNSSSVRSPDEKKVNSRKSLAPEDKIKERSFRQIEQFVDSEIEKEQSVKTAQQTFRNAQQPVTVAKGQNNKVMNKASSAIEMKTSSTMDTLSRITRESKNFTPDCEKKSQQQQPEPNFTKNKKKAAVTISQENKERKTETSLGRTVSPRRVMPVKEEGSENVIQEEIEKWRIFGKMMAESYDALNKKYTDYMVEKEKDKKIINALKEQVSSLKTLLKEAKQETLKHSKSTSAASSVKEDSLLKEIENIKVEHKETNKTVEFLKVENDMLKNSAEETMKYKELAEHFQKLAESRFKECSALAEEIICLRTDLDRSHSNFLRIQREQGSAKKGNGERMYSGRKLRQAGDRESGWSFLGSNNSASTYKRWSERNAQDVSCDVEDQPPTPVDFSTLPSKEENIGIRG